MEKVGESLKIKPFIIRGEELDQKGFGGEQEAGEGEYICTGIN